MKPGDRVRATIGQTTRTGVITGIKPGGHGETLYTVELDAPYGSLGALSLPEETLDLLEEAPE